MKETKAVVNGLDVAALQGMVQAITEDPSRGTAAFRVKSRWTGGTRSEADVESYEIGGRRIDRAFRMRADEPVELLGNNTAPNPQEILMAALNACMLIGYVAGASVRGIAIESLEIETAGELDLRGFLGIDPDVKPGYDKLRYTVRIKGDGTAEQFREIHETVMKTSPNYFNIARPITLESTLEVR
ncbi:MAG: OsmC family protein [Alphaproteobacteria bacterium]|nr:OsmC family protein [Alphaproteobacteria bacterium]